MRLCDVGTQEVFSLQKNAGVYIIRNLVTKERYLGSSQDLPKRWRNHRSTLRRGVSNHPLLQDSFNKYGEQAFTVEVLHFCPKMFCVQYEQNALDCLKPELNRSGFADSTCGVVPSKNTRIKMRDAKLGTKCSEEHKARVSASLIGNKRGVGRINSKEHRAAISKANSHPKSEETRARMRKPKSEEHKAAMRMAWILRKQKKEK